MAIRCGYFDSATVQYPYTSTEFGQLIKGLIDDGVIQSYRNEFEVVRNGSSSVIVKSGRIWLHDHWIESDSDETINFTRPDFSLAEKNLYVIVSLDLRSGNEGVSISTTTSDQLVSTNDYVEFRLAILRFSTSIDASFNNYRIEDARVFATSKALPNLEYGNWEAQFKKVCEDIMAGYVTDSGSIPALMLVVKGILKTYKTLLSLNKVFNVTKTFEFSNSDYSTGFDKYDDVERPIVKVCGNICYLTGAMRYFGDDGNKWLNGGNFIYMGKLPAGVPIPPSTIICKNHASTGSSYRLIIWGKDKGTDLAGRISASRICGYERTINGVKYTAGQYRPAVVGDRVITSTTTNRGEWFRLDSSWIVDEEDLTLVNPDGSEIFEDSSEEVIEIDSTEEENIEEPVGGE